MQNNLVLTKETVTGPANAEATAGTEQVSERRAQRTLDRSKVPVIKRDVIKCSIGDAIARDRMNPGGPVLNRTEDVPYQTLTAVSL